MRIKIEITDYDDKNEQTLGLEIDIYHKDKQKLRQIALALIDTVTTTT